MNCSVCGIRPFAYTHKYPIPPPIDCRRSESEKIAANYRGKSDGEECDTLHQETEIVPHELPIGLWEGKLVQPRQAGFPVEVGHVWQHDRVLAEERADAVFHHR